MRYFIIILISLLPLTACVNVVDEPVVDTTFPIWANNYPQVQNSQETRFDIKVRMNESGCVYFAVLSNLAPAPSSSEIKSGSTPGAVTNGSFSVGADTIGTIHITGLVSMAKYDVYVTAEDSAAAPNLIYNPKILPVDLQYHTFAIATNINGVESTANHIAINSNNIFIIGAVLTGSYHSWVIEKRDINTGALVPTFGSGGRIIVDAGNSCIPEGIALDNTHIYICGNESYGGTNLRGRIERRNIDTGALEGFVSNPVIADPGSENDTFSRIKVNASYIYVSGIRYVGGTSCWWIERRNKTTGTLATGFGDSGSGRITASYTNGYHMQQTALAIDSGSIYTGGLRTMETTAWDWFLDKRNIATGNLDSSFDSDGLLVANTGLGADYVYDLTVDANYIYATGTSSPDGDADWQVRMWDKATGVPVSGFGSSGIARTVNPGEQDFVNGIAVDANYIYTVGVVNYDYFKTSTERIRIEKRYILTGDLVNGFGSSGAIENNPGSTWNRLNKIAVDEHYIYMVGLDSAGPGGILRWVVEKRRKDTGGF